MKMHKSVVDRLIQLYDVWGGRANETKLRSMLTELDLSVYQRQDGQQVVVMTTDLQPKPGE